MLNEKIMKNNVKNIIVMKKIPQQKNNNKKTKIIIPKQNLKNLITKKILLR